MIDHAERSFDIGNKWPYDAPARWESTMPLPPVDWAHQAARGILYDLGDRGGIKHAFRDIDEDVRVDIVEAMAAIIRVAHKHTQPPATPEARNE